MNSYKEQIKGMGLPIFIGYDDNNNPFIVDLTKVGHILVGGSTCSGKTNLLHAFAKSIYYAPRMVFEKCFVTYIDPKGLDGTSYYFDSYLTTMEDIRQELEMLCDKIKKRMNNPNLSRYPIMILCDDFDILVMCKKFYMDMLIYIAERGHLVGVHLVAASISLCGKVFSGRLKANIPTRICFRVDRYQSRLVLDAPDATLLFSQGEMFFLHNLNQMRLQTIDVIDDIYDVVKKQDC
jgi:S-DNA-T family DNA segregation ATPase FtsK/SpoIIIE